MYFFHLPRWPSDGWTRPTGLSTIAQALLAVFFIATALWTFPLRPGLVADDAVVKDYEPRSRYSTTLIVEVMVAGEPVRTEVTVSSWLLAALSPVPLTGDTVPVVRNESGSDARYAGTAAWVYSAQFFTFAAVCAGRSLRTHRYLRR